jgi:hypothetical protein
MGIEQVEREAGYIPAVVYSNWVEKRMTAVDAVQLAADTVANFYVDPSNRNYNLLSGIYALILTNIKASGGNDLLAQAADDSYSKALNNLNETLWHKVYLYTDRSYGSLARNAIAVDSRYSIFTMRPGDGR